MVPFPFGVMVQGPQALPAPGCVITPFGKAGLNWKLVSVVEVSKERMKPVVAVTVLLAAAPFVMVMV